MEGLCRRQSVVSWPITEFLPSAKGAAALGLEAQKAAVLAFINGNVELVAEFTEVESGKHADREELKKAIAACKKA